MKKRALYFGIISIFLINFSLLSCSSTNDDPTNGGGNTNTGNTTQGTIPENTDSGKNNNSNPDNIKPEDSSNNSGDNSGNNSGNGSDNSGNNSGNNSGSGSDNSGNNSGNNSGSGSDNSGNNSGNNSGSGSDNSGSSSDTSSWKLVFEDNFEGESETPNTEYWSLAPKGTDTWNRYMSESYNQAYQKDGYLYLFGMEDNGQYLTGGIESRDKFDFTYGQVKCRARFLRQPQGNHTGIWMMPQTQPQAWPRYGEIDIMEHLDDQDIIYSTVHFWNDDSQTDDKSDKTAKIDKEEFNVYGVVWNNNAVAFTLNGEVIFSYKNENPGNTDFSYQYPFTRPFYLILSQSLGGKGTWEGVIDNSELPAVFQIDWIKVWQKSED